MGGRRRARLTGMRRLITMGGDEDARERSVVREHVTGESVVPSAHTHEGRRRTGAWIAFTGGALSRCVRMWVVVGILCAVSSWAPAATNSIQTVGIYNCYTGLPREAIPFARACGYNTYERWDLGWTLCPSSHERYYAEMAQDIRGMQEAGFESYVLLTTNMVQRREGETEGYRYATFDPQDQAAMQERLAFVTTTIRKLKHADGFTIAAGDPGGFDRAAPNQLYELLRRFVATIRAEAPDAKIIINAWAISTWDRNPSPFSVDCWIKETALTNEFMTQPDILGPDVGIEFPMHNYYRSLALTCYEQAGKTPELCPTAEQVIDLKRRGVNRRWGWPYFLVDECDDGYRPGTQGTMQSETRYVKQMVDTARRLGLNGLVANVMAPNIFAESLNIYAFGRFCNDPSATPEQVISEFAGFIAEPESADALTRVLEFVENRSTWQAGMPAAHRLPDFQVASLRTAAQARELLDRVGARSTAGFPSLPGAPKAYLEKLKQRLQSLTD